MLKTILAVIIIIVAMQYYKAAVAAETAAKEKKAEEINDKKNDIITLSQKQKDAQNAAMALGLSYAARSGMLPVHAVDWEPAAKIEHDYWPAFQEALQPYNVNYAKLYRKLKKVSNKTCKTGFYQKEFDSIRNALEIRANW